jgi:anti-sigma factor ChrR (cupin superfamily)
MHASEYELALYAGGELGFWSRRRIRRHLRQCDECRREHQAISEARARRLASANDLPEGLDWDRLASEMKANIHLGLSAGECVAVPSPPNHLTGWRPALVLSSALAVVLLAYWVYRPSGPPPEIAHKSFSSPSEVLLEVTAAGIGLNDHGPVLTIKHPKDQDVAFSVSLEGAVRSRYVDPETGQVTINNVYVQ